MVIAWMLMASIGILMARYMKYLPYEIFKLKFWFVIHRPLMILVVLLSIIGFILIFAQVGWKWIDPAEKLNFAHSITGTITIVLANIQIYVAFFRPHPNTSKRKMFNWFHRIVGAGSFYLSSILKQMKSFCSFR
jgi:hypothetical protein